MATKSGFSKGWKGFVDHKWSKKRVGTFFNVLSSQTPYQEFAYVSGCSQTFLNDFAHSRHCSATDSPASVGAQGDCRPRADMQRPRASDTDLDS
jgi:hypothetical protein